MMIFRKNILFMIILMMCILFVSPVFAYNIPITYVDEGKEIATDYVFTAKVGKETTLKTYGGNWKACKTNNSSRDLYHGFYDDYCLNLDSTSLSNSIYVIYYNVGVYRGKTVNLKITPISTKFVSGKCNYGLGHYISVHTKSIVVRTSCVRDSKWKFEFIDDSGKSVRVKGNFTLGDIDNNQHIEIQEGKNGVNSYYLSSNNKSGYVYRYKNRSLGNGTFNGPWLIRQKEHLFKGQAGNIEDIDERLGKITFTYEGSTLGFRFGEETGWARGATFLFETISAFIKPEYQCFYKTDTICELKNASGGTIANVPCNRYKGAGGEYEGIRVKNACPQIEYSCEDADTYGKCNIKQTLMGQTIRVEKTDCNDGNQGKTTYKGNTLTKACTYKPKYNYDVDVACEDCDDSNTNGSYEIQDITNWEAILHSTKRTDKPNLQGYYTNGDGVFCREEFNIVFPNKNTVSTMYADPGRYLNVNKEGTNYINGIYNFEPIKVTRKTECISKGNISDDKISHSDMGKVNLNYIETKYGNKFIDDEALKPDDSRTTTNETNTTIQINSSYVDSGTYKLKTKETSSYFKLNDDIYRYVSAAGTSILNVPTTADMNKFVDLKTSNLPITFENTDGVKIQLNYQLPNDSKLAQAVQNGKVDYLATDDTEKDVYHDNSNTSACDKLYKDNNEKKEACKAERMDKTDIANKCLGQFGNKKSDTFDYTCTIKQKNDENCPNGDCHNKCQTKNGKYYNDAGANITEDEFIKNCTCIISENKYIGKFKGLNQNPDELISLKEFREQCPLECSENQEEWCSTNPNDWLNGNPCERCPGTGECPIDGICPGTGEVIYRTIDLINPFPGQSGTTREAGSNWCKRDLENNTYKCAGKPTKDNQTINQLVYNQIINNRGVSGYEVYNQTPLYEITLDAGKIKYIKDNYNSKSSYLDWDLECNSKGVCHSKMLDDSKIGITGLCSNNSNLEVCTEK